VGQTDQDRAMGASSGECELGVGGFIPSKTFVNPFQFKKKKGHRDMEST